MTQTADMRVMLRAVLVMAMVVAVIGPLCFLMSASPAMAVPTEDCGTPETPSMECPHFGTNDALLNSTDVAPRLPVVVLAAAPAPVVVPVSVPLSPDATPSPPGPDGASPTPLRL